MYDFITTVTRMVQLPATAAIEYVAACWVSGARGLLPGGTFGRGDFCPGVFCPGGLLSGGLMPVPPKFNAYMHPVAPSRLSVPSIVA